MIPTFKVKFSTPKIFRKNDILSTGEHREYKVLYSYKEEGDSYQVLLTPSIRYKGWWANLVYKIKFFFLDNYLSFIYDY